MLSVFFSFFKYEKNVNANSYLF